MIIACENCATRFTVTDAAIGAKGRKVKCSSCGHVWRYAADGAPIPAEPPATEPAEPPAAAPPPAIATATAARPPRAVPGTTVRLVALGLLAVGLAGAVFFGRNAIVRSWPPAILLYETLGVDVGVVTLAEIPGIGAGLEYRGVTAEVSEDDFNPTLKVRGEVMNTSALPRRVPTLRVRLYDSAGEPLESWTFSLETEWLEPGEAAPFETTRRGPARATVRLELGVAEL
ncbi:MAG: DUF3426 domain-containing protein [Inquilinus sp.]|nr:DUF3426 domain-containing protein [Inquilinus sp.]